MLWVLIWLIGIVPAISVVSHAVAWRKIVDSPSAAWDLKWEVYDTLVCIIVGAFWPVALTFVLVRVTGQLIIYPGVRLLALEKAQRKPPF